MIRPTFQALAAALRGPDPTREAPLTEENLRTHVHPLFSRVLARDEIYLANHSLGRPLDVTANDVQEALDLWYRDLDGAWEAWLDEIQAFRSRTAALIGAPRPDCIAPKTSAGQGLRTVLNASSSGASPRGANPSGASPRGLRVVTTRGEFDSIDFILKVYAQQGLIDLKVVEPDAAGRFHADALLDALGSEPGLIVVSMVMFGTGQVVSGLDAFIAQAHARGARVLLDLYHAVGVLPVDLTALDADFAIGGSYKYLRGGTGACWLYLHPRHLDGSMVPLDTGWFAKQEPFGYERHDPPRFGPGGDAFLESTPPILPFYQARAGQEFTLALGIPRLRAYSLTQQRELVSALQAEGIPAVGGREDHGAFVVVTHAEAPALAKRLKAEGINTDARGRSLRLCPDLLTSSEDLRKAARRLAQAWHGITIG